MTEAIFGLVGVVVGGLITFGVEWSKTRTAKATAERVASRLVLEELRGSHFGIVYVSISYSGDTKEIATRLRSLIARRYVRDTAWGQYQATLADSLSDDDWQRVSTAYRRLSFLLQSAGEDDQRLTDMACDAELERELATSIDAIARTVGLPTAAERGAQQAADRSPLP